MKTKKTKKKIPQFFINAFYESKFKDSLFVVKASGKVIEDEKARDNLISNIRELTHHGIKVLLIYGAGKAIDELASARGIEVKKHNGRRITTKDDLQVLLDVVGGNLSPKIYESMAKNELEGLSLNAIPADWMDIALRPKKPVNFGFVGDIHATFSRPVNRLFRTVDFIACPCIAWAANDKTLCNINADTIATEIAIATKANKLIFLSDVDGVKIKNKTAFILTAEEIPGLIKNGTITGGMQVKTENCIRALGAGVKRIHLINGLRSDALRKEIFESVGPGTMLITEDEREHYMNEVEAQKVLEAQR
ncbi:MAG: acetylglutamate kinase [Alphaproteobacteria bacterium]|nr:acetylglutamate kinase [Alphaproteobacteria bacterium]